MGGQTCYARLARRLYQTRRRLLLRVMRGPHPPEQNTLSWRLKIWLGTLSTVVAVATGMFTLRDQIFPQQAGTARADVHLYERSVGDICAALNDAERARAANARRLARRLARARSTTAQRNALLDSTKELLARSEDGLGKFEGLDVPGPRRARHRRTDAAWKDIVRDLRRYAEGLDAVRSRGDLLATVQMLPAMRTSLREDNVTRAAGLTQLGGGSCRLDPPSVTKTITLPGTGRRVTPSSGAATRRSVAARTRADASGSSVGQAAARSDARSSSVDVSPSVDVSAPRSRKPGASVDPPQTTPSVDPPSDDSGDREHPARPDVTPDVTPPPAAPPPPPAGGTGSTPRAGDTAAPSGP